ncbi:TMV resistance protein N-like isoform X6 [Malus sylvestris]|uniref:TMV resistance protein N-like isoform X6 n=1 Tax=Malus sylvestris TaxID=3752 RepID=UPI0021AC67B2|nr:TMV resistance protein N-like isoform X6 [Malus sylvestris]XP_050131047.1 TMV resistance protein N-like isoform X6 [Malus sylvestris]XP_050131055.1 TMV resistance protein N-like isoform X6 [Malus sylvestris]XP_050131064.1 TMV resistance protein N-like isoform X6 [Malus sylvestris]XP_050131072.1 TMV resistance protein N-like isoform X6 [Malus sylvestris]XP_050131079.1 TMV resistance protein N-like isoform X6 [Malus sylvestris]XP_050131083.1 TMV resistance protein N-like isoform X6 [Malus sy
MNNQLVPSSSSSSSSFCIDSTPSWRYDVFLSFRGKDTRTNFTDHLYKALDNNGIHTFIDRQLVRGEEISPALLQAIEESRISLVIFSKTYAASRWCLDELVKILQCRQSKQQIVLPVFYKVDASHVRNQTSSFGEEFKKLECKFEDNKEKILAWKSALREAANLSGHPVEERDYEAKLISNIVEDILPKVLDGTYLDVAKYPVGIQSCVQEVKDLLGVDGNGRRVVGIWGPSGIGKTTIAKAVYNAIAHKFQGSCFLGDVRETLTSREGLIQLQKTFLSKTLRGTKWEIVNVHEGISLIKNRLRQKKILLILDDVDQLEQLKNWVDVDCFGEGSRVIITTKDRSLLDFYGGQWIYEVKKLEDDKALELFNWNAFEGNIPPGDYLSLARRAIAYAQGLPLALNIIGSHLRNKCIDRWQAILDGYDSYDGEPYTIIEKILRKTYDAWDYGLQQVFLDIACFFNGENKDYVLQILGSSTLNVRQDCIKVLIEKAIITIEDDQILMHDLLQKMGKQIVYEESPTEPGKRSRLWFYEDVYDVPTQNQGTEKIRRIVVESLKSDVNVIPLNPESFLGMVKLEIFINRNAQFSGRVDYLPNSLRWIDLGEPFIKHTVVLNLSSNFHPRNLVCFDVPHSGIRQLKEFKNFAKLTLMNLSGCEFLEKIPDLSGSTNIRELRLSGCTSLVEVDDSVGFLDKLEFLSLSGCSKLTRFATRLGLRSLRELYLNGCTRLERFPEIEKDKMKSLTHLWIGESGIRELPSSIAYLTGLRELYAYGCELQNVPELSGSIEYLDLSWCSKLTRFATRLGLRSLRELDLSGCTRLRGLIANGCELQNVPDLSGNPNIRMLDLSDCTSLVEVHDSVGFLDKLQNSLPLGGCRRLESFPEIEGKKARRLQLSLNLSGCKLSESDFLVPLDCWSELRELNLSRNNFVSLPDCISEAVNLMKLSLRDCKTLREIPVLPPKLESLHLDDCTSLEKIPKLPPRLEVLTLCNCSGLSGDEVAKLLVAKLENEWLNEEIYHSPKLKIIYPGNEVLKWFNYTSNHPTTIQPEREVYDSEFRFEIPLKLQVGETLTGLLAVSFVLEPSTSCSYHKSRIFGPRCEMEIAINRTRFYPNAFYHHIKDLKATHVSVTTSSISTEDLQGDICQVGIRMCKERPIKRCGVHVLLRNQNSGSSPSEDEEDEEDEEQEQPSDSNVPFDIEEDEEQLHLPLRPPSSLGKRPRPRGSSDIVNDAYDQQQQWLSSSSEPADDHPKRRQIDPNVPFDIEEDEKQEQPTASDDPQFLIS